VTAFSYFRGNLPQGQEMKRKLKNLVKSVLKYLPFRFSRNQKYDAQTLAILQKVLRPGSNAIDVGGHDGEILQEMLKYAPQGNHFCFEPLPDYFDRLQKKFPQAQVYDIALAETTGETSFNYVVTNPAYSGLKKRAYAGKETIKEIKVKTAPLDSIIPESTSIDLIKIDVEGGELGVLKGAKRILSKHKPVVVFEHGKGASEFYGTTPEQVFDLFSEMGMHVSLMENYLEGKEVLNKKEFIRQYQEALNYYFIAHP
jgi:FkbM family methyltransferase